MAPVTDTTLRLLSSTKSVASQAPGALQGWGWVFSLSTLSITPRLRGRSTCGCAPIRILLMAEQHSLYIQTTCSLSCHLWVDTWVASVNNAAVNMGVQYLLESLLSIILIFTYQYNHWVIRECYA